MAYEAIAATTLSSTTSSITFSTIPTTYEHLQIRFYALNSGATTGVYVRLRINGDTATNYVQQFTYGNGGTAFSNASTGLSFFEVGFIPGTTAANMAGVSVIDFVDYLNTNKYKVSRSIFGQDRNGAGACFFANGLWLSTAAINQIQLYPETNSFAAGTVAALYGLKS